MYDDDLLFILEYFVFLVVENPADEFLIGDIHDINSEDYDISCIEEEGLDEYFEQIFRFELF